MALKRLPNDVQSLLCASSHVNNYKIAVEELVYNSLDAESTSIAIRINIQDSTIQVIDNGCGITKHDFNELGQRYMTSKVTNISSLKSAPKKYGYRGEFLANIITISQTVKITSRYESTEETWAKTFHTGKEKKFSKMTTRPTKGTTVDIKGFLHNLHIQKSTIDPINDQQNIKSFLEHLSLVHNDISLSLRDDSKNEIIFKIHKKRDIYQTLLTLFNIEKADVLELQVEKNEYKVKAFIAKTDSDLDIHWVYLNRKCIHNSSKLQKIINDNFKKVMLIKEHRKLKHKKDDDENNLFKQNIPFYFAFVTCPYIDYDISYTPRQVIEFKNWEPINKLLEKLVKFYVGDMNLKEVKKPKIKSNSMTMVDSKYDTKDTRNQVEIIMKKILGMNSKKIDVSQLQNGVKGKLIKRKKKSVQKGTNISKLLSKEQNNDKTPATIISSNVEQKSKDNIIVDKNLRQITKNIPVANKIQKEDFNAKYEEENQKSEFKEMLKNNSKPKCKIQKKININPHKQKSKQRIISKKIKVRNENDHGRNKITETDLVYRKSKIIARKAEEFLRRDKKNVNTRHRENTSKKSMDTKFMQQMDFKYETVHKAPKNRLINQRMLITHKLKPFKTTYDLLQTILTSQRDDYFMMNQNISNEYYGENPNIILTQNALSSFRPKVSKEYTSTHKLFSSRDVNTMQRKFATYFTNSLKENEILDDYDIENIYNESSQILIYDPVNSDFINNTRDNPDINYSYQKAVHCTSSDHLETKLTYESHHYYRNEFHQETEKARECTPKPKQNIRFITKQSEENFASSNIHRYKNKNQNISKSTKANTKQVVDQSSYTIECSESNVNEINSIYDNNYIANQTYVKHTTQNYKLDPVFGNTYAISPSILPCNIITESQDITNKYNTIQSNKLFVKYSNTMNDENSSTTKNKNEHEQNHLNFVFVSKSQCSEPEIEPLNVCETVLPESDSVENEFNLTFHENNQINDSLYNNLERINTYSSTEHEPHQIISNKQDVIGTENVSHHFSSVVTKEANTIIQNPMVILQNNKNENRNLTEPNDISIHDKGFNMDRDNNYNKETNNFNFKNRLRFVPKGMSQIFENCRTKNACNYILDKDYYEDRIYNNFAHDVQVNTEIYEPKIQNFEDLTTRDIHKFQTKVQKTNASLTFDEKSLRYAKVLGQADCKFIAAIVAEKREGTEESTDYLVLFDQHAVHERIRLENNLADYINEDRWRSTPLDNVSLKLSKDEILYLHNYKDKFNHLGLQWTILNENEISINSIPKAILGKNPREVVKVIKAVKNLIIEEINVIKIQKGCLALYPKSIMELVFSEACRYAIKFGDHLSKNDCVELIKSLSACKTPFQCAHGRSVMAVIMDIKCNKREYKISKEKLCRFRSRLTRNIYDTIK